MIKKLLYYFLAIAIGFTLLLNDYVEARSFDEIKQSGSIKIAIRINNPPMGLGTDGNPQGIDPDLARMLAQELGVTPEWKILQGPKEREEILFNKQVDLVISSFSVTPERLDKFDFSNSYYATGLAVMILAKNKDKIREYSDLVDKKITVTEGSMGEKRAMELLPNATFVPVKAVPDTYDQLKIDKADAIVNDEVFLRLYQKEHSEFHVVENLLLTPDDYAIGIGPIGDRNNQEIAQFVNKFLAKVKRNGELDKLVEKYVNQKPKPSEPPKPLVGKDFQVYTVQSGDSLSKLALDFYENSTKHEVIFQVNSKENGGPIEFANVIKPGWKLKIPPLDNNPTSVKLLKEEEEKPSNDCKNVESRLKKLKGVCKQGLLDADVCKERQKELANCF